MKGKIKSVVGNSFKPHHTRSGADTKADGSFNAEVQW